MTRLQIPHHQRVPRRTKTKPANKPSSRDGLINHRSNRPQSQTAGPGDGRARRRRRRRGDDDDGNVRGTVANDDDGCVVVAVVDCDDVGGAVGAAVVGGCVGVGVPRGCLAPKSSESSSSLIGRRSLSPSFAGCGTTEVPHHHAALSHGEEMEGLSVAGSRGRSAGAGGRRDGRSPSAGANISRDTSDRGRHRETAAQA